MMNEVTLIGNLGKAPDIIQLEKGLIANLRIATNESYTDKSGQKITNTEWHTVAVYVGFLAEKCRNLTKGDKIFVKGTLRTRTYQKDGIDHKITEVIVRPYSGSLEVLRRPNEGQENPPIEPQAPYKKPQRNPERPNSLDAPTRDIANSQNEKDIPFIDDEIPF